MQGCEPAIEPWVTHQGWKPINALKPPWVSAEEGGIFGLPPQLHPRKRGGQRLGWQLGGAAAAGHGECLLHGGWPLKAGHEGMIDALLEAPEQREWPKPPGPPLRHGRILMGADQLEGLTLRSPGAQGSALAG